MVTYLEKEREPLEKGGGEKSSSRKTSLVSPGERRTQVKLPVKSGGKSGLRFPSSIINENFVQKRAFSQRERESKCTLSYCWSCLLCTRVWENIFFDVYNCPVGSCTRISSGRVGFKGRSINYICRYYVKCCLRKWKAGNLKMYLHKVQELGRGAAGAAPRSEVPHCRLRARKCPGWLRRAARPQAAGALGPAAFRPATWGPRRGWRAAGCRAGRWPAPPCGRGGPAWAGASEGKSSWKPYGW